MRQPLAGVVGLFAAGILLGRFVAIPLPVLFGATLFAGVLSLRAGRLASGWLSACVLLCGWTNLAWQIAPLAGHDLRRLVIASEQLATLRGRLETTPQRRVREHARGRTTNTVVVLAVRAMRLPEGEWRPALGKVLVSTAAALSPDYWGGVEVEIDGILRRPLGPRAPGLFDYAEHLRWRGIDFELRAPELADWTLIGGRPGGRREWGERFRGWARETLARGLPEGSEEVDLLWAMTLGWKEGLTEDAREPFVRSGTLHLFAISGLHVAMIAGALMQLLGLARVGRRTAGLVVIPILWFYTLATGSQPSAVRATVMMTVIVGGWMLRRPVDLLNSLSAAALVALAADPRQLFQTGFQLSFAVVGFIGLWVPPLMRRLDRATARDPFLPPDLEGAWKRRGRRLVRWVAGSLAVSGVCWLGAAPLSALYFQVFTPVSLLANVLVVPLGSAALASCLGSLLCGAWWPGLGEVFNHGAWLWMHGARRVSAWSATLPGAWWSVQRPPIAGVALWYLVGWCLGMGWWRDPRRRLVLLVVAVGLLAAMGMEVLRERYPLRAVVVAARGGQAVYVEDETGEMLIDAGDSETAEAVVAPLLQARGVNVLDAMVLTHGDVRHVGGATGIVARFPQAEVAFGPVRFRSPVYRRLLSGWNGMMAEVRWREIADGEVYRGWRVLHPARGERYERADDGALVLAWGPGERTPLLLVSDLGRAGQERLWERHPALRARLLVAGLPEVGRPLVGELLRRLEVEALVVVDDRYPATARTPRAVTARWREAVPQAWFTSETGNLELLWDGERWRVRDARGREAAPSWSRPSVLDEARVVAGDEVQDRHADGEAVGDLFEDH